IDYAPNSLYWWLFLFDNSKRDDKKPEEVMPLYAKEFKVKRMTKEAAEYALMAEISEYLADAERIWVREVPDVTSEVGTPEGKDYYLGYARIAKLPKGLA